jgi:hypothetical protein
LHVHTFEAESNHTHGISGSTYWPAGSDHVHTHPSPCQYREPPPHLALPPGFPYAVGPVVKALIFSTAYGMFVLAVAWLLIRYVLPLV